MLVGVLAVMMVVVVVLIDCLCSACFAVDCCCVVYALGFSAVAGHLVLVARLWPRFLRPDQTRRPWRLPLRVGFQATPRGGVYPRTVTTR